MAKEASEELSEWLRGLPDEALLAYMPYRNGQKRPAISQPLPNKTELYTLTPPKKWEKEMLDITGRPDAIARLEARRTKINDEANALLARFSGSKLAHVRDDVNTIRTVQLNRLSVELARIKKQPLPVVPPEPSEGERGATLRRIQFAEPVPCPFCGKGVTNRGQAHFCGHVAECEVFQELDRRLLVGQWRTAHRDDVNVEHREWLDYECTQGRNPPGAQPAAAAHLPAAVSRKRAASPAPTNKSKARKTRPTA